MVETQQEPHIYRYEGKQVSRAGTSNYIPQYLWDVITCPSPWYLPLMMTSSNGNIFRVTGPLCGEFTGPGEFPIQRPVTRSFDVFFYPSLNKRLSKQPWGWWFETLSWSLWRQCNVAQRSWYDTCTCTLASMIPEHTRHYIHTYVRLYQRIHTLVNRFWR